MTSSGHRLPSVAATWNDCLAGSLNVLLFGHAQEVPSRVFNVVRIHIVMRFKLLRTTLEITTTAQGDSALPIKRCRLGPQFDDFVKELDARFRMART
jgi:hypothetical protein